MPNGWVLLEWHAVNGCLYTGVGFQCRAVGTWSAVALVISYELLMMIIRGAQAPGEQRRLLLQGNLSDWRRSLFVTISPTYVRFEPPWA
jgi:hypothetical protein